MKNHTKKLLLVIFFAITGWILLPVAVRCAETPDLQDAINNLKLISRANELISFPVDADSNDSSGIEDVSYILQYIAGLREYDALTFKGISVSGKVINIDDPVKSAIPNVTIQVNADIDGNGTYQDGEKFISTTDNNGYFTVKVPSGFSVIPKLKIITQAAGYSEYIKSYTQVQESFYEAITLSQGDFLEISVAGISTGAPRAGRMTLNTDQTANIQLIKDQVTGRSTGRAGLGRFAEPPSGVDGEVVNISFPLRGLKIPADSEKIYANVAYLDTVNNSGIMPGNFVSEGEDDTPLDMLQTFAATMIKIYDEHGNELMNDPFDYSNKIKIKIAIPPETYSSLVDEDETTSDKVEVPFYYFDEAEEMWKLHRDQYNEPVYGWLVDNFGNILSAQDLLKLKTIKVVNLPADDPNYDADKDGTYTGTEYQPAGVASTDVTIFQIGEVNHFTNWNCDRSGRSTSYNFDLEDKYGNPIDPLVRYRKRKGGRSDDYSRGRKDKKNRNLHTYVDSKIDSLMKNFLSKDKKQRESYLNWILKNENPELIQALMRGLRRYAENQRMDEQGESNELKAGIRRIFTNQMLTDAIINTNDLDGAGIDCSKAPDLCKGALAQAAEQVGNASDAKKATAFLMQIAVDAYNPGKLDFEYALDKGIGMIELAANRTSASGELGTQISSLVKDVKGLKDNIKNLYVNGKPPLTTSSTWKEYWEYTYELRNKLGEIKSAASTLGSRINRKSLPRTASRFTAVDVGGSEDLQAMQKEALWDYEDIGGLLYGAHKFSNFQWGYYHGNTFHPTLPPANLAGGGEVGMLEYFDGNEWTPFPGRSNLGVDPAHIPVPNVKSFQNGSESMPTAYLGKWVLDMKPNVVVSGRLVDNNGNPHLNAKTVSILVDNQIIHPDETGSFSDKISIYKESVYVNIPGTGYYKRFYVRNNAITVGDVSIPDKVLFNGISPDVIYTVRNTPLLVDAAAFSLSGSQISYDFKLKRSYWSSEADMETTNTSGMLQLPGFENIGRYYLDITATADNDLGSGVKPSSTKRYQIFVKNQDPEIKTINISESSPRVGDVLTATLDILDSDSTDTYDDIRSRSLRCKCSGEDGQIIYVGTKKFDDNGSIAWHVNTDNSRLFSERAATIDCTLSANIYDKAWGRDSLEKKFTISQNYLPPEIRYNNLKDPVKDGPYATAYSLKIYPSNVRFTDKNSDIVSYSLDSGKGENPVVSDSPILDMDPDTPGRQGIVYDTPKVINNIVVPYTFTYEAVDSKNDKSTVTTQILIYEPLQINMSFPDTLSVTSPGALRPGDKGINNTEFDIVELPTGDIRSFSLGLFASTKNPDEANEKYLTSMSYTVRYEPSDSYYWQTIASGSLPLTDGKITGSGSIDLEINKPGKYYIFANATDGANVSASFSKIFFVSGDFDLEITLDDKKPDDIKEWYLSSDTLNFQAMPTDTPDGFSASYLWEVSSDGGTVFSPKGTAITYSDSFLPGSHIIRMTLKNSADANQAPVIKTFSIKTLEPLNLKLEPLSGKTTVPLGELHNLAITNVPDNVTITSAYWQVRQSNYMAADNMYEVEDNQSILSRNFIFNQDGTYIVSVSVTDSRGVTGFFESDTITIIDYPPVITTLSADTTIGPPPLSITCTSEASDTNPDASGVVVNYIWDVSGTYTENGLTSHVNERFVFNNENNADVSPNVFTYEFGKEGIYRISLTVEDDMGRKSSTSDVNVTVLYRPPVITEFSASPFTGTAPLTTTISAVATDIDSNNAALTYSWDIGADGTIDSTSQSFDHTFTSVGNFEVALLVTDDQGLTAHKKMTIYSLSVDQNRTLNFKELWNAQLGATYNFDSSNEEEFHHEDSKTYLLRVGDTSNPVEIPQFDAEFNPTGNTSDPAPSVPLLPGYNGFLKNEWGTISSVLFDFQNNGTYDVGLKPTFGYTKNITLKFPETYDCGVFFSSTWADTYNLYEGNPKGVFDIYLYDEHSRTMNPDGQLNILAKLGTKNEEGQCECSYYGFTTLDAWPILDEDNPPEKTLQKEDEIGLKTIVIPEGYGFDKAIVIKDGIRLPLSSYNLETYANGNIPLPIVDGASYEIFLTKNNGANYTNNQTISFAYSEEQIQNTMVLEPDISDVTSKEVSVSGNLLGADTAEFIFSAPGKTHTTRLTSLSSASTAFSDVGHLRGADTATVLISKNSQTLLKYKKMPAANLSATLNLDTFTGVAAPVNLSVDVNQEYKTLNVTFESDASLCIVDVKTIFQGEAYAVPEQNYHFIVPGSAGTSGIKINYPIPSLPGLYGSETPVPGTDDIVQVDVTVSAIIPSDSYEEFIRNTLKNFGLMQWYLYQNHNLMNIDAVNTSMTSWSK